MVDLSFLDSERKNPILFTGDFVTLLKLRIAAMTVLLVLEATPTDACLEHERIALLQLKPFFNNYNTLANWDDVKGSDCCEWSLYLPGNAIAGCIENEGFEKLSSNLSNQMKGSSHPKGFQWLSRLRKLFHIQELNNLTKLKYLDLSENRIESISDQDETHLRLLNLEELDLTHIKGLENLTNLKELDLRWNGIESLESYKDDATQRQQMIHLEELRLDGNLLNNSVFAFLNGFSNLKSLSIRRNRMKGSLDMKDLDAFSSLRELYMSNNQLNDFVIHKGCCDLKKLEVLDLSGNAFEGMLPHGLGPLR
ncbi:hypothetical protein V6N13_047366 [Hibiscus sabdariffa]